MRGAISLCFLFDFYCFWQELEKWAAWGVNGHFTGLDLPVSW